MLLALNVAVFGLGFAAALITIYKPKYTRSDATKLLHQLQSLLRKLKSEPTAEVIQSIPAILPDTRRNSIDDETFTLMTKSVLSS